MRVGGGVNLIELSEVVEPLRRRSGWRQRRRSGWRERSKDVGEG